MMPWANKIGSAIEQRWRERNYDLTVWPELAVDALAGSADLPHPDEIVRWVFSGVALPEQDPHANFGQPPIMLFRSRRFYLEALFWTEGTTAVHQHAFSGAFKVLAGSSIETRFDFDEERVVDGYLKFGRMKVLSTSFLRAGHVRPIYSGSRLIHSLFHLERPSVTLVLRTFRDSHAWPQFDYAKPGIAHDPFFPDVARDKTIQLVSMLQTVGHSELESFVGELLARADLHTAYRVLRELAHHPNRDLVDRLVMRVGDEDFRGRFAEVMRESRREHYIRSRRPLVRDPVLRFFLGVLMNAHRWSDVHNLLQSRDSSVEPAAQVALWLRQLSTITARLQAGGVSWEPSLLGLPEFSDESEKDLASVLRGRSEGATAANLDFLRRLKDLPALECLFR